MYAYMYFLCKEYILHRKKHINNNSLFWVLFIHISHKHHNNCLHNIPTKRIISYVIIWPDVTHYIIITA